MCLCVCVRRQFLMQGFISHRLEAVNSVVWKICVVLPSGMIQSHYTWIKPCPTSPHWVGYFRILGIVRHFHFSLSCSLTRAPLEYSAEHAPLGGGGRISPPLPNSRTRSRSEVGKAANESSRWVLFKQILKIFLKGHMSGQGQVKDQNRHFSPYRLLRRD